MTFNPGDIVIFDGEVDGFLSWDSTSWIDKFITSQVQGLIIGKHHSKIANLSGPFYKILVGDQVLNVSENDLKKAQ